MKKKWILIIVFILGMIGWFVYDASQNGIKTIFNMSEVLGPEDNNPYGIRNDVYTYLNEVEFKKWNLGPREQMLLTNYVKLDRLMTKNFNNKEKIIELDKIQTSIITCFEKMTSSEWSDKNLSDGYQEKSNLIELINNTKDRKIISEIIDNYFNGKILYWFDYENNKIECQKYMEQIYDEK